MCEVMELAKTKQNKKILIIKLKITNAVHTHVNCYAPNTTMDKVNFLHQLQDTGNRNRLLTGSHQFNVALEKTDNIAGGLIKGG